MIVFCCLAVSCVMAASYSINNEDSLYTESPSDYTDASV